MPFPLPSDPFNRSTPLLLAADRDGTYQPYVYVTVFEEQAVFSNSVRAQFHSVPLYHLTPVALAQQYLFPPPSPHSHSLCSPNEDALPLALSDDFCVIVN